jgi:H+/Cl- antiporter ClcA
MELLRSKSYVVLLVVAAVLGVPIAGLSYLFLVLAGRMQGWLFTDLPKGLGFGSEPTWWPVPVLMVGGLLVALVIRYLPGDGGESPAEGFHASAPPTGAMIPGVALAALATLGFGAVLGPEAPLIALGGGIAVWAFSLARRDAPAQAVALIGATGSFAAIATLLGSPLLGAFLLMEVAGLGVTMSIVLLPGLLAAGIGSLIFIGLDSLTGLGAVSLEIPNLPAVSSPTFAEFGWALVIGVVGAFLGTGIRWIGLVLRPHVERMLVPACMAAGLVVALLAVLYAEVSGKASSDVLFSGQDAIGPLITKSAEYSGATLTLLILCKGLAYGVSLSSFRGGPVFPSMFLGAALGMALSHLPGLDTISGAAMGIGAVCVAVLGFPLVSVLLATLLLASDGLEVMPLVIVAVVVSYVVRAWLLPPLTTMIETQKTAREAAHDEAPAG